jgi:hypothetical protein
MKETKRYCENCESEDKVRLAKYECVECGVGYCANCEKMFMGDCGQCPPPILVKIKSNKKK